MTDHAPISHEVGRGRLISESKTGQDATKNKEEASLQGNKQGMGACLMCSVFMFLISRELRQVLQNMTLSMASL